MRTGKRFLHGLLIGLSMFICMTSSPANPAYSQSAYTIIHKFIGGAGDGLSPYYGGPVLSGSTLYGMTPGGGDPTGGVLFKINTDGTGFHILHNFGFINTDGTTPRGSLTLSGSTLYGCTPYGGGPVANSVGGTIFRINSDGQGYEILHNFGGGSNNQCHPYGAPVISGSWLYGMTSSESAGTNYKGEIFAMNTESGDFQVLYEFGSVPNDGAHPYGSLTLSGSRLYGWTYAGGIGGGGVIFSLQTPRSDAAMMLLLLSE